MSRFSPRSSSSQITQPYPRPRSQSQVSQSNSDYEEFASLQLDRPNEAELKTNEEMKKHLFDDHFEGRPIERAMHILAVGEEVQRLSVIRDLLPLIQADEQGCMQRVIPKILQALGNATTEFHIETAKAFSTLLERKAVSPASFAQSFLPAIIFHVDNRDQVVSNAWLEALLYATEVLPLEIVKNHIFGVAINKGQISQNVYHRLAACQLLGKIGSRFDSHVVKKDILPVVLSLCQDVNESVRACICSQLHLIAKGVPPDMIKSALIPILVELGRDETIQVRVEAIETIVKIIPFVNQDLLKATIIPLIKKICEQAFVALDDTLIKVAKQFGSLCINLENVLTQAEKLWMVTYYHNMSHLDIPFHGPKKDVFYTSHNVDRVNAKYSECRQFCAYNFPAIAKFCANKPELLEHIFPSFCDFTTDPYFMVRKTIGASMHEVAKILSTNNRVVKNQVMTLLWDNMEEVLMGVVPNLGTTIECLISSGVLGQDQDGVSYELGRGLLQCDKTIREKTHNWRLYTNFITQLEIIVKCLPSDYIYSHFVSLMFDKMHRARPLPCRLAAARTLLIFLRYNLKNNQRQEIRSRLQSEFCLSSSCYKRMLYLRLCNTAREVFSRSYFKEHFFYPLLSRSEDKVPNNRLLLIRQFPFLKAMIILPTEKKYLQTLETCVRSMAISEKDKDVTAELKAIIHKMDKTETLNENSSNVTPEDIEDRKKQEEEVKVANSIMRAGAIFSTPAEGGKKTVKEPKHKPNGQRPNLQGGGASSSSTPSPSPRSERLSYSANTNISPSYNSISPSSTFSHSGNVQGFTNTTNKLNLLRTTISSLNSSVDQNCTCYSTTNFRSDTLRNLNLLALIDTNFSESKESFSETIKQKLNGVPHFKLGKSAKHSMEISWLNLETDLKNELFFLLKNRQIHGDRNFKQKSKFLTDFRNYNESTLSKFLNEDRDYKETIYNVTGVGTTNYYERGNSNFFEERLNFFEKKIQLEDSKPNNSNLGDCSCFEVTTNKIKPFELEEIKRFSYFSKNFEEDFYRDAGIKANDVLSKKFSGIPICDKPVPQLLTPKISTSVTNKRRTWFGNENSNQSSVKLETITGFRAKSFEKKKSETLPTRDSISLKRLGIGPRSKSFILSSNLIHSDKESSNFQSTKVRFDKENEKTKAAKAEARNNSNLGSCSDSEANRFGFRSTKSEPSLKAEEKIEDSYTKTKIPLGRIVNGTNAGVGPSTTQNLQKNKSDGSMKTQTNGTKKIPMVVSRKSMLIQSNSVKNEIKNKRKSLDPSKISLANLDKGLANKKKNEKILGKVKNGGNATLGNLSGVSGLEEQGDKQPAANAASSKLPVRKPKSEK